MKESFRPFIEKELGPGFVLIACGLPGTWKTETTEEVARLKGCSLLRSDLIRLEVLKNEDVFDEKTAASRSVVKVTCTTFVFGTCVKLQVIDKTELGNISPTSDPKEFGAGEIWKKSRKGGTH